MSVILVQPSLIATVREKVHKPEDSHLMIEEQLLPLCLQISEQAMSP